jgi:hypothetical protein
VSRLKLRYLLAYLDDLLERDVHQQISQAIQADQDAHQLTQKIHASLSPLRMSLEDDIADELEADQIDANFISEYLDGTSEDDTNAQIESICSEDLAQLAEVAACHQLVSNSLPTKIETPVPLRKRLYELQSLEAPSSQSTHLDDPSSIDAFSVNNLSQHENQTISDIELGIPRYKSPYQSSPEDNTPASILETPETEVELPISVDEQIEQSLDDQPLFPLNTKPTEQDLEKIAVEAGLLDESTDIHVEISKEKTDVEVVETKSTNPDPIIPELKKTTPSSSGWVGNIALILLCVTSGLLFWGSQDGWLETVLAEVFPQLKEDQHLEPVNNFELSGPLSIPSSDFTERNNKKESPQFAPSDQRLATIQPENKLTPPSTFEQPSQVTQATSAHTLPNSVVPDLVELCLYYDNQEAKWKPISNGTHKTLFNHWLYIPVGFTYHFHDTEKREYHMEGDTLFHLSDSKEVPTMLVTFGAGSVKLPTASSKVMWETQNTKSQWEALNSETMIRFSVDHHMTLGSDPIAQLNQEISLIGVVQGNLTATLSTGSHSLLSGEYAYLEGEEFKQVAVPPDTKSSHEEFWKQLGNKSKVTFSESLHSHPKDVSVLLSQSRDHQDENIKLLAAMVQSGLGEFDQITLLLNDPTVSFSTKSQLVQYLRTCFARGDYWVKLIQKSLVNIRREKAELVYRELWGYSPKQIQLGAAQNLVEQLDHAELDIRFLSHYNLQNSFPTLSQVSYDSQAEAPERRESILKIKAIMSQGGRIPRTSEISPYPSAEPLRR